MRRPLAILTLAAGLGIAITAATPAGRALAQQAADRCSVLHRAPKRYPHVSRQRQKEIVEWNREHPEWVKRWKQRQNLESLVTLCFPVDVDDAHPVAMIEIEGGGIPRMQAQWYPLDYQPQMIESLIPQEEPQGYDIPKREIVDAPGWPPSAQWAISYGGGWPNAPFVAVTPVNPVIPIAPTPEPGSLLMVSSGLASLAMKRVWLAITRTV